MLHHRNENPDSLACSTHGAFSCNCENDGPSPWTSFLSMVGHTWENRQVISLENLLNNRKSYTVLSQIFFSCLLKDPYLVFESLLAQLTPSFLEPSNVVPQYLLWSTWSFQPVSGEFCLVWLRSPQLKHLRFVYRVSCSFSGRSDTGTIRNASACSCTYGIPEYTSL